MALLKNSLIIFYLLIPSSAQACPACLTADDGRFINQTLLIMGVMGLMPILLALVIGLKVYRLCRTDSKEIQKYS